MQEGQSCERFQQLYGSMPRVRTPAVKWDATARRVLTMEWIEGVKLTNKPVRGLQGRSGWAHVLAGGLLHREVSGLPTTPGGEMREAGK